MPAPRRRPQIAPRALARRTRRLYDRTPLRIKLVATLLLLVLAALVGSGAIAATTLRTYLVGRVDTQLASVQQPISEHGLGTIVAQGKADHGDGGDGGRFRLPSAYVIEVRNAKGGIALAPNSDNLVNPNEPLPMFQRVTGAQAKAAGTRYYTTSAVRGDEQWRVLATPVKLADGSTGTLLIAQSLQDVQNTVGRLVLLFVVIGAATLVILAGIGYFVVRASLRPLRAVERTAAQIAAGDLSHRVPDAHPRTEVGHLADALNTMLTKIETAFAERAESEEAARRSAEQMRQSELAARRSEDRMRRFIADASHELRTPLTSIRGFAELYRQGAADDENDVRRWMGRIEDEAKRMGVLVEDLLLLARLDQERPLARLPVDVLALVGDAVHDARALDPDRPITLDVGATDPPPVVIGDEARLRQVLANLLTNVRKHTPPGTPVTVAVSTGVDNRVGGPAVTVAVADEGPGMTDEAAARVFERFYRADTSRSRSGGNTGLGLAIVAALVAGHGGAVEVQTSPGAGACFRVALPLAEAPAISA